jgi:hypothetical protein
MADRAPGRLKMYPSLPEEEAQTSVAPHAVTLEADIAALIQVVGGSHRCPRYISHSNTEQVHLPPLIAAPKETGECPASSAQNSEHIAENCPERRTQGPEIRSCSADKILNAQRTAPAARAVLFKGVLFGSLGTGAIFGLGINFFDILISGPAEQRELLSIQALSHKNVASGRRTTSAASGEKTSPFTASIPHSTRNAAQRFPVARQNSNAGPMSFPETRPTTIEGWMVRDVIGGAAVLEGPGGVWSVTRGDTVPGVGTVDSIVRWGNRWIVATSRGLISTP